MSDTPAVDTRAVYVETFAYCGTEVDLDDGRFVCEPCGLTWCDCRTAHFTAGVSIAEGHAPHATYDRDGNPFVECDFCGEPWPCDDAEITSGLPEQGEGDDDTTTVGDGDTTCDEAGLPVDVPVSDGAHSHDVGRLVSEPDPDTEQGRGPGPDTGPLHLDFAQLRQANLARVARWHAGFPHDGWSGADWSNAAAGEMGEAANVVKKLRRGETAMKPGAKDPSRETLLAMLADEIADTITYLDLLAAFYGIDVAAAVIHKFNAVSEREGFPDRLGDDR